MTRLRSEKAFHESVTAVPTEAAFLVNLSLRDVPMQRWVLKDGTDVERVFSMSKGGVGIVSLERGDTLFQTSPFRLLAVLRFQGSAG